MPDTNEHASPALSSKQPADSPPLIIRNYTAAQVARYIDEHGCFPSGYWTD